MAAVIAKIMNLEFDPALHVSNFSGSGPAEATGYGVPGPWDPSDDADLVLKFSAGKGIPTFQRYGFPRNGGSTSLLRTSTSSSRVTGAWMGHVSPSYSTPPTWLGSRNSCLSPL
jgi:hypothetical protein